MHKSALGFLVQRGEIADAAQLSQHLQALEGAGIEVISSALQPGAIWHEGLGSNDALSSREMTRALADSWRVTSYSGLQQHSSSPLLDALPKFDIDAAGETADEEDTLLTPHHFPRGAAPGTFLHGLFESIDFTEPPEALWLEDQLQQNGYSLSWLPVIQQWIARVLTTPLNKEGVTLASINSRDRLIETEFYLPINNLLTATDLDALVRRYDPLSQRGPALDFRQVKGMLKGFIDLVFRWQGKYYLLDYKSNWLGESHAAYTPEAMEQAMIDHRYDLQYQLYTLALHRYLQHRLAGYDYQQHFGGVFYLFLRGVDGSPSDNGIFATRPDPAFIDEMDRLFGNTEEML